MVSWWPPKFLDLRWLPLRVSLNKCFSYRLPRQQNIWIYLLQVLQTYARMLWTCEDLQFIAINSLCCRIWQVVRLLWTFTLVNHSKSSPLAVNLWNWNFDRPEDGDEGLDPTQTALPCFLRREYLERHFHVSLQSRRCSPTRNQKTAKLINLIEIWPGRLGI